MTIRPIHQLMSRQVYSVSPDTPVSEALRLLETQQISCVVVLDRDKPIGIFSEWDVVTLLARATPVQQDRIAEHMHPPLRLAGELDVREAYARMAEANQQQAVVVDKTGTLLGLITEGDLLHLLNAEHLVELKPVREVMLPAPPGLPRHASLAEAALAMARQGFGTVLVTVDHRPVGILTERDMVRLMSEGQDAGALRLDQVMSQPVQTVALETSVHDAAQHMEDNGIRRLAVIDAEGRLQGLLTRHLVVNSLRGHYVVFLRELLEEQGSILSRTRRRLQGLEQQLIHRSVMAQIHDAVYVLDPHSGRLLDANDRASVLLGYRQDELLGLHAWDISNAIRDQGHWQALADAIVEDDDAHLIVTQHRAHDGSAFPVETSFRRVAHGGHAFIVAVARDLRERQRSEAMLNESRARYQALFEGISSGVAVYKAINEGADFIILDFNRAAEQIEGVPREAIIGRRVTEVFPGVEALGLLEVMRRVWRSGHQERLDLALYQDAQRVGWRENTVYRLDSGEVVALYQDVTAWKLAQDRLQRSESQLRNAQRIARLGSWELDHRSGELIWSEEVFRIFELEHKPFGSDYPAFLALVHPDDREAVDRAFQAHLATGAPYDIVHRLLFSDGQIKHVHEQCETEFDPHGVPLRSLGTVHDISEIKATEQLLLETQQMLRLVINTIPHAVFWKDRNSIYLGSNERFALSSGVSSEADLVGKRDDALIWHEQAARYQHDDAEVMRTGVPRLNYVEPQTAADGRLIWLETSKMPLRNALGEIFGVLGIYQDITARRESEEQLRLSAAVFENTREGVMITDPRGHIVAVNRAFSEITGYGEEEVLGQSAYMIRSGRHDPDFYATLWATVRNDGHWQGEIWNRRKNGEVYPELLTVSCVRDEGGKITHYVGVFADISRLKQSEEQLERLAHYDPLTQLPNRLLLQFRLAHSLELAERDKRRLAVMFLDLDRFKNVNDSLGHPAGDELLTLIAARLAARLRDEDTIARLGGDEFIVVLEDLRDPNDAANLATQLIKLLSDEPFRLMGNHDVYIGASIGISLYPDDGHDSMELIRNADTAMYQAKAAGRNTYRFYTEELTRKAHARLSLETRLRQALENDELTVHYQPQLDVASNRVTGVEALARWQHPEDGLISPAHFIPLAEESGLIIPLGDQVLRKAMTQTHAWHRAGFSELYVAVNLSSRQFQKPDLAERLGHLLDQTGLRPDRLELEITESLLLEHGMHAMYILGHLRDLGIKLAIDDFGTGYSSLAYLKRLPIHKLKIDQGFVQGIPHDTKDMEIASTIIAMAHNLRLEVLAEGVETSAQLDFLRTRGCDAYQGYLYSPPVPAPDLAASLNEAREAATCTF